MESAQPQASPPEPQPEDALSALIAERDGLRGEIRLFEDSIHKAFLTALTFLGGIVFGLDTGFFKDPDEQLLFFLAQTQMVLGFFVLWLYSYLNLNRAYIADREEEINRLTGGAINVFESRVVRRFMFSPHGSFFWIVFVFLVAYACLLVYFVTAVYVTLKEGPFGAILIAEGVVLVAAFLWVFSEPARVRRFLGRV